MEHCLWENSFICLNILTQTQQPAEQDNCRISTDGEVFPVGPYLCWRNGARCQHIVGAIGCSKLWQFIRLYQISKSQVDHQGHSFCFTGRAPASSHHWQDQTSAHPGSEQMEQALSRYHHTASPSSHLTLWGASSHLTEKIRQIACCRKFIPVSKCTFQMVGSHLLPDQWRKLQSSVLVSNFCQPKVRAALWDTKLELEKVRDSEKARKNPLTHKTCTFPVGKL